MLWHFCVVTLLRCDTCIVTLLCCDTAVLWLLYCDTVVTLLCCDTCVVTVLYCDTVLWHCCVVTPLCCDTVVLWHSCVVTLFSQMSDVSDFRLYLRCILICVLLGCYAGQGADCLPTFQDNLSVPSSIIKKYNPSWISWSLKTGPVGCSKTTVTNYTLRCVTSQKSADLIFTSRSANGSVQKP